jgi:hypothetical protein
MILFTVSAQMRLLVSAINDASFLACPHKKYVSIPLIKNDVEVRVLKGYFSSFLMSNSNNDEKKGKEIDHDLAKLVKEIFNSETRFQPTEGDLVSEDQIHDPLKRAVVDAINKLLDKFLEQLIEYFQEQERSYDFSQQSTSSS